MTKSTNKEFDVRDVIMVVEEAYFRVGDALRIIDGKKIVDPNIRAAVHSSYIAIVAAFHLALDAREKQDD